MLCFAALCATCLVSCSHSVHCLFYWYKVIFRKQFRNWTTLEYLRCCWSIWMDPIKIKYAPYKERTVQFFIHPAGGSESTQKRRNTSKKKKKKPIELTLIALVCFACQPPTSCFNREYWSVCVPLAADNVYPGSAKAQREAAGSGGLGPRGSNFRWQPGGAGCGGRRAAGHG